MHRPFTPHELEHVISTPRFSTYLDACAQNPERALALYRWNLEISAGFNGPTPSLRDSSKKQRLAKYRIYSSRLRP